MAAGPQVGGTFTFAWPQEPSTLDAHKTAESFAYGIMRFIGASLVELGSDGEIYPYLAESWDVSDDGLVYTFNLRDGVTFHNGEPFTAADYKYTIERAIDPETASPGAGGMFGPIASVEAPDDLTLVINLAEPFFPFLISLATLDGYIQPLNQTAVEGSGDDYGRNPVGVGPYRFVEWITGERIVLERNPDFDWAPGFADEGGPYIETLVFRILPEDSVRLAAIEAGEADYSDVRFRNLGIVEDAGGYDLLPVPVAGASPMIFMNSSRPPFDDVLVRRAVNLAINKDVMIQVHGDGNGTPQAGPLSPAVIGYAPEVEELGYPYDPAQARGLLEEAGYTLNADGIYEKDGIPLSATMIASTTSTGDIVAQVAADLLGDIGMQVEIEILDQGVVIQQMLAKEYDFGVLGYGYPDADILFLVYSSKGAIPIVGSDPALDEILDLTRSTVDPLERQQYVTEAQIMIIEQAYIVPLYASNGYFAVNSNVAGITYPQGSGSPYLFNAYFTDLGG